MSSKISVRMCTKHIVSTDEAEKRVCARGAKRDERLSRSRRATKRRSVGIRNEPLVHVFKAAPGVDRPPDSRAILPQ